MHPSPAPRRLHTFAASCRLCPRTLARASAILLPLLLQAQDSPPPLSPSTPSTSTAPAASDEVVTLAPLAVTGSYLPAAAEAVAIPVITLDKADLEAAGTRANLLDAMRRRVPQLSGNANVGSTNANASSNSTNGGSQLSLRNAATLVLVNGRRMAAAPVAATGGYVFTDVNAIPLAAIRGIDILPDGASATYGTDAVSGVVNVLLRDDFRGLEIGGRYGFTDNDGHAAERSVYAVGGAGDDRTSVTVSAEWARQDPIFNRERPYSAATYGTVTFPGVVNDDAGNYYVLSSSVNSPGVVSGGRPAADLVADGTYSGPLAPGDVVPLFNLSSRHLTQTLENERSGGAAALSHVFNERLRLFGDILASRTDNLSALNAQPVTYLFAAGDPQNPFDEEVLARNRFVDYPREYRNRTDTHRIVLGLDGKLSPDWNWQAAVLESRALQAYTNPNVINADALDAAVAAGTIDMFARRQAPGAIEQSGILGTSTGSFDSRLVGADARVFGTLTELPAGPLDLAVGVETRHESLSGASDPRSQPDASGNIGWLGADSLPPFHASRDINSLFAELRVPVLKDAPAAHFLELTLAGRHEAYSDSDDPTVPKVTLRYLPLGDSFALRGTFSKSFTAPTLYELNGPESVGYTESVNLEPAGGGPVVESYQANRRDVANPDLDPSTSTNYTLGFVLSPERLRGFSLSVDYFDIAQRNLVSRISDDTILQDVEDRGPASPYSDLVRVGSFDGPETTGPGQVAGVSDDIYLTNPLANLASVRMRGFDFSLREVHDTQGAGVFTLASAATLYTSYAIADQDGGDETEFRGTSSFSNGTLPRWQVYTSLEYAYADYSATLGWRHIPGVDDIEDGTHLKAFNSFDLSLTYTAPRQHPYFGGLTLTIGVDNLFNRFGPLDPTVNPDTNVDIATYGAMGRFFYVDAAYRF